MSPPAAETDRVTREVESILRAVPEVVTVATTVGPGEEVDKASIRVKTTPKTERKRSLPEIMEALRPSLAAIPGLVYNMRVTPPTGSATSVSQAPVTLQVRGEDLEELRRVAEKAFELVRTTPGVRDAALSYKPGMPERRLVVDRVRAGDLGVSLASVATMLRTAIEGDVVAKYRDGEHDRDIRVQLRPEDRSRVDKLSTLAVPSRRGRSVYVKDVTRMEETAAPATIERLNRERQITISANVMGRSLGEVLSDLEPKLNRIQRPPGYTFRFAGEAERMRETLVGRGEGAELRAPMSIAVIGGVITSTLLTLVVGPCGLRLGGPPHVADRCKLMRRWDGNPAKTIFSTDDVAENRLPPMIRWTSAVE